MQTIIQDLSSHVFGCWSGERLCWLAYKSDALSGANGGMSASDRVATAAKG